FFQAEDGIRGRNVTGVQTCALPFSRASVRYGDMLGIRYLSLDPTAEGRPAVGGPQELAPGQTLPLAATTPPVDLTALVNGFKPLFEAVEPEEVNALRSEEHTSELQSRFDLVCRLLLEKKNNR